MAAAWAPSSCVGSSDICAGVGAPDVCAGSSSRDSWILETDSWATTRWACSDLTIEDEFNAAGDAARGDDAADVVVFESDSLPPSAGATDVCAGDGGCGDGG